MKGECIGAGRGGPPRRSSGAGAGDDRDPRLARARKGHRAGAVLQRCARIARLVLEVEFSQTGPFPQSASPVQRRASDSQWKRLDNLLQRQQRLIAKQAAAAVPEPTRDRIGSSGVIVGNVQVAAAMRTQRAGEVDRLHLGTGETAISLRVHLDSPGALTSSAPSGPWPCAAGFRPRDRRVSAGRR